MKAVRHTVVIILLAILFSCNQQDAGLPATSNADTTKSTLPGSDSSLKVSPSKPAGQTDTVHLAAGDSLLLKTAENILVAIKDKDFIKLSSFVHPKSGIRFSPYAYVDTVTNRVLSVKQLAEKGSGQQQIAWGRFDGTNKPIRMSIGKYFDRFVYDKDFLHAEKRSVNKFLGSGNSLNNLKEVYPHASFAEFYFPGFDPKYGGMDWRTLRLVFQTEGKQPYLIAIVHDEWTI